MRPLAYSTAFSNAVVAQPVLEPYFETCLVHQLEHDFMPLRSWPRSSPMQLPSSPKFRVQVAEPLIPFYAQHFPS